MTGHQYRVACRHLALTIYQSAKVLGIHRDTAYRYANNKRPIPKAIEIALRAMVRLGTVDI